MKPRVYGGVAFAALIFFLVQVGAVALVPTFYAEGYQQVEDPTDPTNSLLYVGAILVATALMLGAFKYDFDWAVRGVVVLTSGLLSWYVFAAVLSSTLAIVLSAAVAVALLAYPEWYVIDTAGVLMGAGAAALFGISFGVLPAVVLLLVLAVYDAISVYGTEHMLTLASGMMEMRVPVVFVVPLTRSYTFLEEATPDSISESEVDDDLPSDPEEIDAELLNELGPEQVGALDDEAVTAAEIDPDALDEEVREELDGGERDALFIGLGDAVIPSVLVASAAFFVDTGPTLSILGVEATLPAVTGMVGTLLGLTVLLWLVHKGRAHAGLPLLNGGTIAGYLVGAVLSGLTLAEALGLESFL